MKKIISLIAILVLCLIPGFVSKAEGTTVDAGEIYVDIEDSIDVNTSYNNNLVSLNSANNSIATAIFDKTTKKLTIKGVSRGNTTITMRLQSSTDYIDYVYTVYVISEFGSQRYTYDKCTYDYNKIIINYDSSRLPDGCIPVFSMDGKNWSESNTIVRNQNDDGYVYKNYMVDGLLKGKTTKVLFRTKKTEKYSYIEKEITIKKGETISLKSDLLTSLYLLDYGYSLSMKKEDDDISFDKNTYSIKGLNRSSYNSLYIEMLNKNSDFSTDGSYTYYINTYHYKIEVTNEDGSTYDNTNTNNEAENYYKGGNRESDSVGVPDLMAYTYEWVQTDNGWRCIRASGALMSYLKSEWECIDNIWYYFDSNAYMASNEYRDGYWLNSDGSWNSAYANGAWKSDSYGWWYEDAGWYPTSQWMKIDGYWYYFKSDGYMACNEYIDGYWLGADGAWR